MSHRGEWRQDPLEVAVFTTAAVTRVLLQSFYQRWLRRRLQALLGL